MIDILLVMPNFPTVNEPPLGLLYMAAVLRQAGVEVEVVDGMVLDLSRSELVERIVEKQPKIIGFSCTTPGYAACKEVARKVRKLLPESKIIFGGQHPTFATQEVLDNKFVDCVVRGEGEVTCLELVRAILNNRGIDKIKGISFKKNGRVVNNPSRELIDDLDNLPHPARDLVPIDKYEVDLFQKELDNKKTTAVLTSRGCPFRCSYCSSTEFWGHRPRKRSVGNIIKELKQLKDEYGFDNIVFQDDIFTFDMQATKELCRQIIKQKLNIFWGCSTRADFLDEKLIGLMRKSGCLSIYLGVESGSEKILRQIKKGIKPERIGEALKLCRKYEISTGAYIQFGLPGETDETIEQTFEFLRNNYADKILVSFTTLYPGTRLYGECIKSGRFEKKVYSNSVFGVNPAHGVGARLANFITPQKMSRVFERAKEFFGDRLHVYKVYGVV